MQFEIPASVPVVTSDGVELGRSRRVFIRRRDVDPLLKLYAAYLQTRSLETGDDYYIPTEFIVEEPAGRALRLTVDFNTVQRETWTRMPSFIAHGDAEVRELPVPT